MVSPYQGQTLILRTGLDSNLYTFEWTLNGNVLPAIESAITINDIGNYSVTVTLIEQGCQVTAEAFTVTGSSGPESFSASFIPGSFSDNFRIIATAGGIGIYEFSLDDGPFQASGTFEVGNGGLHFVTIRDINGCGEVVIDLCVLDYPKFFTPNADGFNDTWNLINPECGDVQELFIFNRYGKLIRQLDANGIGWDGMLNGELLPATDYWFLVNYIENGENKNFRSHFTLKR